MFARVPCVQSRALVPLAYPVTIRLPFDFSVSTLRSGAFSQTSACLSFPLSSSPFLEVHDGSPFESEGNFQYDSIVR